ncbi:zinc ribbon domain-containing protein [Planomonospora alba]|uniref:Zinc ribbon domain-containing protein n=1 Tax=Planomonospora alba TaxID=161354 RepID=A0ABP6P240_9ACTN
MPTYQYACTACDNQFEIVQKFTDDALTVCPSCQGELRKVFSAVGIVFKGSGFYRTDSRSSNSSTVSSTSSGSGSKESSASKDSSGSTAAASPAPAAAAS